MQKIFKLSALLLCLLSLVVLSGCGISEDWAEKINVAAAKEEHYAYDKLMSKFGTPVINATAALGSTGNSGIVTWAKGYDAKADADAAYEDGKTVKYLYVTFVDGKATSATYEEKTKTE